MCFIQYVLTGSLWLKGSGQNLGDGGGQAMIRQGEVMGCWQWRK